MASERDKHLEAAAEALRDHPWNSDAGREATAKIVVGRYLDSLLGDIPEEATKALLDSAAYMPWERETAEDGLKAALRSLRTNLDSGDTVRKGGG